MDKETLKSYLAEYYKNSKVIDKILKTFSIEINDLENARIEMINQLQPETATYALSRWENDYRLENKENYEAEFRRSIIVARMRGNGTCTKEFIKSVALSYGNGEVEVIEPNGVDDFTLVIKFVGKKGIPPNLKDFKKTIEEIIPAHLVAAYQFTYTTWEDIKSKSWEQLAKINWQQVKEFNNTRRA